jgi:hypothetical protein
VGSGGEINQALYAHMNNKRKMKKKIKKQKEKKKRVGLVILLFIKVQRNIYQGWTLFLK